MVIDEILDDWIYGCMGSAMTDFNFKFLKRGGIVGYNIGYWSDEATYNLLYKTASRLLHIPSNSSPSHPFRMIFWDISGYSSAEIILWDISFSNFGITNCWVQCGWMEWKEVLDEHSSWGR